MPDAELQAAGGGAHRREGAPDHRGRRGRPRRRSPGGLGLPLLRPCRRLRVPPERQRHGCRRTAARPTPPDPHTCKHTQNTSAASEGTRAVPGQGRRASPGPSTGGVTPPTHGEQHMDTQPQTRTRFALTRGQPHPRHAPHRLPGGGPAGGRRLRHRPEAARPRLQRPARPAGARQRRRHGHAAARSPAWSRAPTTPASTLQPQVECDCDCPDWFQSGGKAARTPCKHILGTAVDTPWPVQPADRSPHTAASGGSAQRAGAVPPLSRACPLPARCSAASAGPSPGWPTRSPRSWPRTACRSSSAPPTSPRPRRCAWSRCATAGPSRRWTACRPSVTRTWSAYAPTTSAPPASSPARSAGRGPARPCWPCSTSARASTSVPSMC